MSDLISRQAAIDAICKEGTRLERNGTVAMCFMKKMFGNPTRVRKFMKKWIPKEK